MSDEDLGRLLRGILNFVKAGFVIGLFTLGVLVMTHWHEKLLAHGWNVVRDTETAQHESSAEVSAEDHAPPRPVHHRRRISVTPPEPVVDDEPEQAAPVAATPIAQIETAAPPSPVVVFVHVPEYSLTVTARKHHRWPRRFFGAIGRGLGKVIGVR
jgi:hypothetical protein